MRVGFAVAMMGLSPLALAATTPLQSGAVTAPVTLVHEGQRSDLATREAIAAGDEIRTGSGGSAELYFLRDSLMTLGANSALLIHSSEPAVASKSPILRLQLLQGTLKLDAYPPAQALAHDYRLNVGPMRARALGADLWASATPDATVLCLLHGAIEITGAAGNQRLDSAGDCARIGAGDSTIALMPDAATTLMATRSAPDAGVAKAGTAAPSATADHQQQRWTVVLASMLDQASAERAAQELRRPGQPVSVIAVKNLHVYRVVSGQYDSREAAAQAAQALRLDHGAADFWPTTLP